MSQDYFAHKAADFDKNKSRTDNVQHIADTLTATIALNREMHLMDFGSGTGLLLERIAPQAGKITAVDVSESMNAQLLAKQERIACELELRAIDLVSETLDERFDGIISSMTLHHIADIPALLRKFHQLLKPGGFIALADLDREDGSFHSEDTGVFHHGFDRDTLCAIARDAGFSDVTIQQASVISKPHRDFSVFLLTAHR